MVSISQSFVTNSSNFVLALLVAPQIKQKVIKHLLHIPDWKYIVNKVDEHFDYVDYPEEIQKLFDQLDQKDELQELLSNHAQKLIDQLEKNEECIVIEIQTSRFYGSEQPREKDIKEYAMALLLTYLALNGVPFKEMTL